MPPPNPLSFPKSSIKGAPAPSRVSASSSASNASPYAARKPHRTLLPSSRLPARSSWSNPSTLPSVLLRRVAVPVGDEFVDQLIADGSRLRLQPGHRLGGKRWQQQLLVGLVVRRVGGDCRRGDRRLGPHLAHDDAARREVRAVVGDGAHVLVAGRQIGALVPLGVGDRATPSQLVPDRKGIFPPARVQ